MTYMLARLEYFRVEKEPPGWSLPSSRIPKKKERKKKEKKEKRERKKERREKERSLAAAGSSRAAPRLNARIFLRPLEKFRKFSQSRARVRGAGA